VSKAEQEYELARLELQEGLDLREVKAYLLDRGYGLTTTEELVVVNANGDADFFGALERLEAVRPVSVTRLSLGKTDIPFETFKDHSGNSRLAIRLLAAPLKKSLGEG